MFIVVMCRAVIFVYLLRTHVQPRLVKVSHSRVMDITLHLYISCCNVVCNGEANIIKLSCLELIYQSFHTLYIQLNQQSANANVATGYMSIMDSYIRIIY